MSVDYLLMALLAIVMGTISVRLIPFYTAQGLKDHPLMADMGLLFPAVTMPLLVIFCLKDVNFSAATFYGSPELIGVMITASLHIWKRQVLLSICGGVAAYWMLADYLYV